MAINVSVQYNDGILPDIILLIYFIATMSFAGYFLPVLFCMLSMLISDSRLIWFGSVYLVTTAGFVADQLM